MPGFNGTGPNGAGPMTGRGMGACAGYPADAQGFGVGRGLGRANRFGRAGYGFGRGIGRRGRGYAPAGFRFGGWSTWQPTAEEQKEVLKNQADFLENELKAIREELGQYEDNDSK